MNSGNTLNDRHRTLCIYCGGVLNEQTVTYLREYRGRIVIIKHVPALVCATCGEQYYAPHTVDRLHATVRSGKTNDTETVPVFEFPQLA